MSRSVDGAAHRLWQSDVAVAAPAVSVDRVTRLFAETATPALDDVSLAVPKGAVHALLGPNGAGKTTLLWVLAGLVAPTSGRVEFTIEGQPREGGWTAREFVGIVPAGNRSFYLRLTGVENLAFFGRLYGLSRREALARSREVLTEVGLDEAGGRRVGLYSQGMKRRLTMARALMVDPPVLLVDEATHDLDPAGARVVRRLVRECTARGTAVVWATQRLDELPGFADQVTVLAEGRVAYQGSPEGFAARATMGAFVLHVVDVVHESPCTVEAAQRAIGPVAAVCGLETPGHLLLELHDPHHLGAAIQLLEGSGLAVRSCRDDESVLERAFLLVTATGDVA